MQEVYQLPKLACFLCTMSFQRRLESNTMKNYYIYILANRKYGALYIGVTNDLIRRVFEHRQGATSGFTSRYGIHMLVYFEQTTEIEAAIIRETNLKTWRRAWKIRLIERSNPEWKDLYLDLY